MMSTLAVGMLSYVQINLTTEKKKEINTVLCFLIYMCAVP